MKLHIVLIDNEAWSAERYSKITASTYIFKLMYKDDFEVITSSGKETIYGHMKSEYDL